MTENLLLAAHSLGLGARWLGVHPRKDRLGKLRGLLFLPETAIPVACVAIGRPGGKNQPRKPFGAACARRERW